MLSILLTLISTDWLPYVISYTLLLIICLVTVIKKNKGILNVSFFKSLGFITLISFVLIFSLKKTKTFNTSLINNIIIYFFIPAISFISGYYLTINSKSYTTIMKYIYCIALGSGIHVILNLFINMGNNRFETIDFYSRNYLSATNLGSLSTIIFSIEFCFFLSNSKLKKYIGIVLIAISILYGLIIGTRTQLAIAIIIFILELLMYFYEMNKDGKKYKLFILGFILICIFATITICYNLNVLNIKNRIESTNLFQRFNTEETETSDNYRTQLFLDGFKSLIENPSGLSIHNKYFHNFWLDVGRVAGIIPFVLSVICMIVYLKHSIKLFKCKKLNREIRFAIIGLSIGFFCNFFDEPIMDGYLNLFYKYCLIFGIIEALYNNLSKYSEKIN